VTQIVIPAEAGISGVKDMGVKGALHWRVVLFTR